MASYSQRLIFFKIRLLGDSRRINIAAKKVKKKEKKQGKAVKNDTSLKHERIGESIGVWC